MYIEISENCYLNCVGISIQTILQYRKSESIAVTPKAEAEASVEMG